MDGARMFWEFKKDIFSDKNSNNDSPGTSSSQIPYRIRQNVMGDTTPKLEPLHIEVCKDAIGWVEKVDNLLVQCAYDGVITTYIIKNLEKIFE